jgi:hypothetical protein
MRSVTVRRLPRKRRREADERKPPERAGGAGCLSPEFLECPEGRCVIPSDGVTRVTGGMTRLEEPGLAKCLAQTLAPLT